MATMVRMSRSYADNGKWNGYTFTQRAVTLITNHSQQQARPPQGRPPR